MVLQKYRWLNFQVLLRNIRKQEAGQPLHWMNAFIANCGDSQHLPNLRKAQAIMVPKQIRLNNHAVMTMVNNRGQDSPIMVSCFHCQVCSINSILTDMSAQQTLLTQQGSKTMLF